MKSFLRRVLLLVVCFYYLAHFFPGGFTYQADFKTLITAVVVFILLDTLVKPLLKIIFIPINLLTFGFFRWIINVFVLFFTDSLVRGFEITSFRFEGLAWGVVSLAPHNLSFVSSLVIFSCLIVLMEGLLEWLRS